METGAPRSSGSRDKQDFLLVRPGRRPRKQGRKAMRRLLVSAVAVAALWGFVGEAAQAQFQRVGTRPQAGPLYRPPLSPYLNLARGGNPAINYYGLVRPIVDANASL